MEPGRKSGRSRPESDTVERQSGRYEEVTEKDRNSMERTECYTSLSGKKTGDDVGGEGGQIGSKRMIKKR